MRGQQMAKKKEDSPQKKRRNFTSEYKAEVVRLVKESGKTPYEVAREMGLPPSSVRMWVNQKEIDGRGGGVGPLTSGERDELTKLRREVKTLRVEREILKRATAFFAKEGT